MDIHDAQPSSQLLPKLLVPGRGNYESVQTNIGGPPSDLEEPFLQTVDNNEDTDFKYRLYSQRWLVLIAFSSVTLMNGWMWISASPIASILAEYWSVSLAEVDALSSVFMYSYIPFSGPALYALHRYHLRFGLLCGAGFNFLGSAIRYCCMRSYLWFYVGQLVASLGQAFTLAIPPLLAGTWFGGDERATATSLGVIANNLGGAFGLGITVLVRFKKPTSQEETENSDLRIDEKAWQNYVAIQMVLSLVALIMVIAWVGDRPRSPPSEAAAVAEWQKLQRTNSSMRALYGQDTNENKLLWPKLKSFIGLNSADNSRSVPYGLRTSGLNMSRPDPFHTLDFMESIKFFLREPSGWFLSASYGLTVGVFYAMATFLSQFVLTNTNGIEWTEEEAGYLGIVFIMVGLLGSIFSGYWLDKSHAFHGTSIALLVGATLSQVLFGVVVQCEMMPPWVTKVVIYTAVGLLGIFLAGFISVGFEYGTAISYPADEAAVAGILNVAAQLGGWIIVHIGGLLQDIGWTLNAILVALLALAWGLLQTGVTAGNRRPLH
eukprot:scaffold73883_cov54-Attheya_sp.AAC.1